MSTIYFHKSRALPNDYFQFKKFIIYQDKCSMKVCTDACILGAWTAKKIASKTLQLTACLDVGAGTGLLSLMLAQKSTGIFDAIEIEDIAFKQLKNNFRISEWRERLVAIHADARSFAFNKKYDLVISNPPFYENDLLSKTQTKNIAKHNERLTLNELIPVVKNTLNDNGNFVALLPYHRLDHFEKLANEDGFFLKEKLLIKPTLKHEYFRGILLLCKQKEYLPSTQELIIKNENNIYTDDFVELMQDYYLAL